MVVISLEKCPASLRGDLTKWLQEISLGVYVGNVSARVRENLWERICEEAKSGRATMVFSARNEQGLDFRVHNTTWEPIDFDGIKLMLRPSPMQLQSQGKRSPIRSGASTRAAISQARRRTQATLPPEYVVVDIETTGLDPQKDEIIEIAALKVSDKFEDALQMLVRPTKDVPDSITRLTGLSKAELKEGRSLSEAVNQLLDFVGTCPLVMHNATFDIGFLDEALMRLDNDELDNECIDTLAMARKRLPHAPSYKLGSLAKYCGIPYKRQHRALPDCMATKELFVRLMEL